MDGKEAAQVIAAMAESLRSRPDQFQVNVMTVGVQAVAQGGGTGLSVTAGGPGSVGMNVTASAPGATQIQFGEGAANQAIAQIADHLDQMAAAADEGDKGTFASLYAALKDAAAVPALLASSIGAIGQLAHLLGA